MENRKGVWIPIGLYSREDLSVLEMILLTEIDMLDNSEKGCFASNLHFSKLLKLSEGRTANMVSDLKKREFIYQTFFDGRNRGLRVSDIIKASLNSESRFNENVKEDFTNTLKQDNENVKAGSQKREHNRTFKNSSNNPSKNIIGNGFVVPESYSHFSEIWKVWIEYKAKQHKFYYKLASTELIAFEYLIDISKGNLPKAEKYVKASMMAGYKKVFPTKEEEEKQPFRNHYTEMCKEDEKKKTVEIDPVFELVNLKLIK
jgi:hypothetical protein